MATIDQGSDEIITRAEQTRLQKERQVPTQPRDRIEMAATLLKDPKVMKAAIKQATTEQAAARVFSTIVYDHNADRRKQERERALQKARDGAMPLPAYMVRMVAKMNEWTGALAGITNDEIEELPEGPARDSIGLAALALAEQADRWVAILRRRPALQVIEGRARRS
jgi:hypothetical protein